MNRFVCIHGHFYQPPRENPWLEAVELQDSAYPYHDWNERITAECYAPNSASRILDAGGRILRIVNNYSRISFNFGPTLLAWLKEQAPSVYGAILTSDQESRFRFSGHGSAMAQAYNHMILPLANSRDKRTQVIWGIRDFEHRFGRSPEGMWLAETAVDLETLDILAEFGIRFTVLAPNQAHRYRAAGARHWKDVSGGRIDPSTAYQLRLPSGNAISLFFYDGPISRAAAFEKILEKGEYLAERLRGTFDEARRWPQLAHMATDGETYGHHRPHADMALAFALHILETDPSIHLTNYGEFLEKHPPEHQVQIHENSSWSCVHGVERWRADCGCNSGMHHGWNQEWRAPLRAALDWLRDQLAALYEEKGRELFEDPWQTRDDYISVILDRSPENTMRFLAEHKRQDSSGVDAVRALKMLETQRHAMLMYTSCGWFFDELSGIETVQVIQYAGRALQLAQELSGDHLEEGFLDRLAAAKSNLPEHGDGRKVYEKFVRPATVTLEKVGAHYAISSLFEDYPDEATVYSHTVTRQCSRLVQEGGMRLVLGRAQVKSRITQESGDLSFGVLHLGDQNVHGGVREYRGEEAFRQLQSEVTDIFRSGDVAAIVHAVDRHFGAGVYSVRLLFRDEQRKIVRLILESALQEAGILYQNFYRRYGSMARFVADLGIPFPDRFRMAIDFTLHEEFLVALSAGEPDPERIQGVLEQIRATGINLDTVTAEYTLRKTLDKAGQSLLQRGDLESMQQLEKVLRVCPLLPFQVNLWVPQNTYYEVLTTHIDAMRANASGGDIEARECLKSARAVGEILRVRGDWNWPERDA